MDHICEYYITYMCILIFKCDFKIIYSFVVYVYSCVVRLGGKRLHPLNHLINVDCFYTVTHHLTVEMHSERCSCSIRLFSCRRIAECAGTN